MEDNRSFQHQPLDHSSRQIRLLKVLPELSSDSLIQCQLEHRILDEDHTCLSYMWGDATNQRTIRLNRRTFLVPQNLWNFLELARDKYTTELLWIDAICIDQENVAERGHQVVLMGEIYSMSKHVLVYLGKRKSQVPEASGVSRECVIRQELQIVGLKELATFVSSEWDSSQRSRDPEAFPPIDGGEWNTLVELCELPYWRRIWIKQELVNARSASLLWGEEECSYPDFASVTLTTRAKPTSARRNRMLDLEIIAGGSAAHAIAEFHLHRKDPEEQEGHFSDIFYAFGYSDCSDVRDRVYALLPLANVDRSFPVDYELNAAMVFVNTIKHCGKAMPLHDLLDFSAHLITALKVSTEDIEQLRTILSAMDSDHSFSSRKIELGRTPSMTCRGADCSDSYWELDMPTFSNSYSGRLSGAVERRIRPERSNLVRKRPCVDRI